MVSNDFRYSAVGKEKTVELKNPAANKLIVKFSDPDSLSNNNDLSLGFFPTFFINKVPLNNVRLRILPSPNDSFLIRVSQLSNGISKQEAEMQSEKIDYVIHEKDSALVLKNYFFITRADKFRNQQVVVKIYVPQDKQIIIERDDNAGDGFHLSLNEKTGMLHISDEDKNYEPGVLYTMKSGVLFGPDGLKYRKREEDEFE